MSRATGPVVRAIVGVAVSVVALAIVLRGIDIGRTAGIVGAASPAWLGLMLVFASLDLALRAIRWQRLLAPIKRVAFPPMLGYLLIGYLANNVLPARLGELVRSHYLGDREGVSRTTTLGTVVVERVIDTAVVVAIAAASILVLHVRGVVANAVLVGLAVTAVLVVGLAVGILAHRLPYADRVVARIEHLPRVVDAGRKLQGGLSVAGRPRTVAEAVALTFAAWTASTLAFAAAGQAVGTQLTVGEAALLASGVALAAAIPAGPGNLGTYELAGVSIAALFGIGPDRGFAIAVLAHAGVLLVTSVGGAVALVRIGWTRSAAPAERAAAERPVDRPVERPS